MASQVLSIGRIWNISGTSFKQRVVLDVGFGPIWGSSKSRYIVEWGSNERKFCLVHSLPLYPKNFQKIH